MSNKNFEDRIKEAVPPGKGYTVLKGGEPATNVTHAYRPHGGASLQIPKHLNKAQPVTNPDVPDIPASAPLGAEASDYYKTDLREAKILTDKY
jgi:hypothetical protein